MAKPSKAQITYGTENSLWDSVKLFGDDPVSTLRFHAVISEEHTASSRITKFPVQKGFNVSNHAIIENRVISIKGIVTDNLIVGSSEFYEYSSVSNSKVAFSVLTYLIQKAVPCSVITNLGVYNPVVFNKIKTKQMAGMTDAIEFTITGEELQLGNVNNKTTPTKLSFKALKEEERQATIEDLRKQNIVVGDTDEISVAKVDPNESFQLDTTNLNSKKVTRTFQRESYDRVTGEYSYTTTSSEATVVGGVVVDEDNKQTYTTNIPEVGLSTGTNENNPALEYRARIPKLDIDDVDVFSRKLRSSNRVVKYRPDKGVPLLSTGQEAFIINSKSNSIIPVLPSIPTVTEVLTGAKNLGDRLFGITSDKSSVDVVKVGMVFGDEDDF